MEDESGSDESGSDEELELESDEEQLRRVVEACLRQGRCAPLTVLLDSGRARLPHDAYRHVVRGDTRGEAAFVECLCLLRERDRLSEAGQLTECLQHAASRGYAAALQCLLAWGADARKVPTLEYARSVRTLELLLEAKADVREHKQQGSRLLVQLLDEACRNWKDTRPSSYLDCSDIDFAAYERSNQRTAERTNRMVHILLTALGGGGGVVLSAEEARLIVLNATEIDALWPAADALLRTPTIGDALSSADLRIVLGDSVGWCTVVCLQYCRERGLLSQPGLLRGALKRAARTRRKCATYKVLLMYSTPEWVTGDDVWALVDKCTSWEKVHFSLLYLHQYGMPTRLRELVTWERMDDFYRDNPLSLDWFSLCPDGLDARAERLLGAVNANSWRVKGSIDEVQRALFGPQSPLVAVLPPPLWRLVFWYARSV